MGRTSTTTEPEKPRLDEEELRYIFSKFDYDQSGSINESELHHAIREAGVNCSANSARKVLSVIDANGNGLVEFEEFREFFAMASSPEDLKLMLSRQNQRFFEYKQVVEDDPSFAKTFVVPPMVKVKKRLDGHSSSVEKVAWLSEDLLISCSLDGEAMLWSVGSCVSKRPRPGLQAKVAPEGTSLYSAAASPDGQRLLVGLDSDTNNLNMWSIDRGAEGTGPPQGIEQCLAFDCHDSAVYSTGFSSAGTSIVSGSKHGTLLIHDVGKAASKFKIQGHANVAYSVAFSDRGESKICSASRDGTVKVFDTRRDGDLNRPDVCIEDAAAMGPVHQAMWRDEGEIMTCGDDYCCKRWDLRNIDKGPVECYFGHTSVVRCMTLSGDTNTFFSGTQSGGIRVWHTDQEKFLRSSLREARDGLSRLTAKRDVEQLDYEEGSIAIEKLKATNEAVQQATAKAQQVEDAVREIRETSYTQAFLGCDGPIMPVSSLAWQDSGEVARLAVGSQDQGVRIFVLEPKKWDSMP